MDLMLETSAGSRYCRHLSYGQISPQLSLLTIHPLFSSTKNTELKRPANGLVCVVQVAPPFAVCLIVPFVPTAQPSFSLMKSTPISASGMVSCSSQVSPPSAVCKITPSVVPDKSTAAPPTAQPVFSLTKSTDCI